MKRKMMFIVGAVTIVLGLAGCGANLEDLVQARDECHAAGGVFTSWDLDGFDRYGYSCDLSDDPRGQ